MWVRDVQPKHFKDLMMQLGECQMLIQQGRPGTGRTMGPRTLVKMLTRLHTLFREAVADQIVYVSPMDAVREPKTHALKAVGMVMDFQQAARFQELGRALHAAGLSRLWPALFTAVSGLRRGEVMGLSWSNLGLDAGVMRVRQQLSTCGPTPSRAWRKALLPRHPPAPESRG